MIRAVIDTNVLASGIVGLESPTSTPGAVIDRWLAGQFELVTSPQILTELRRTVAKPYFARRQTSLLVATALSRLERVATIVVPSVSVIGVASHPEDDAVLAAAVSAQVDYLVTGDRQLQRLDSYYGVSTVAPRQFLALLEQEDAGR